MTPWKSPHERTRLVKTAETMGRGRKDAERCLEWMERNEAQFRELLAFVRGMRDRGERGRVRDRAALYCISHGIETGGPGRFFANGMWAGISRYLVLADPSLGGDPIEMADSNIDCYGLLPVSWMEVAEHARP